jgi:hypothetical protein
VSALQPLHDQAATNAILWFVQEPLLNRQLNI